MNRTLVSLSLLIVSWGIAGAFGDGGRCRFNWAVDIRFWAALLSLQQFRFHFQYEVIDSSSYP